MKKWIICFAALLLASTGHSEVDLHLTVELGKASDGTDGVLLISGKFPPNADKLALFLPFAFNSDASWSDPVIEPPTIGEISAINYKTIKAPLFFLSRGSGSHEFKVSLNLHDFLTDGGNQDSGTRDIKRLSLMPLTDEMRIDLLQSVFSDGLVDTIGIRHPATWTIKADDVSAIRKQQSGTCLVEFGKTGSIEISLPITFPQYAFRGNLSLGVTGATISVLLIIFTLAEPRHRKVLNYICFVSLCVLPIPIYYVWNKQYPTYYSIASQLLFLWIGICVFAFLPNKDAIVPKLRELIRS